MKFFAASTILAYLAKTAFAGPLDDFGLGTATTIVYDETQNEFTLTFVGGATSTNNQFGFVFYGFDCETTNKGNGAADGFTNAAFGNDSGNTVPIMTFNVDMSTVKTSDTFTPNGANSEIKLCVRNTVSTSDGSIEVNFQESQITLTMDLTANVITSTAVQKRDKNAQTEAEQTYTIAATLCDNTPDPLQQGDLVTVCMEPSSDDVVINSLETFTWTQSGGTGVSQQAIGPTADTATNALSTNSDCPSVLPTATETCKFASVLKADFYVDAQTVDGSGTATFALNRRRLNARDTSGAEARLLQGLASDVTVAVPIAGADNGPGALKTAGGASFGVSALASGVALLSAALLA